VKYVYHVSTPVVLPSSGTITVSVICPAISLTQPTANYNYVVPDASATQVVFIRSALIANHPLNCPITYELIDSGTNLALTSPTYTWLVLSATGDLNVDINMWGTKQVKIKYTDVYPSNTVAYTNDFTVTVTCPTLTVNALTTTTYTTWIPYPNSSIPLMIIPNDSPALTSTPYVKTNSLSSNCLITYAMFTNADVAYAGDRFSFSAKGDVSYIIDTKFTG